MKIGVSPANRRAGRIETTSGSGCGDHLCWVYDDRANWRAAAVTFLAEGAAAGDQLRYVAQGPQAELVDDLAELPRRDALLASGQLAVMPLSTVYQPMLHDDIDGQVAAFRQAAHASIKDGYPRLRLAADVASLVTDPAAAQRFGAYEVRLDATVAADALVVLCGFDTVGHGLATLRFVHPLGPGGIADGGNRFYADAGRWRLVGEVDMAVEADLRLALRAASDLLNVDATHLDLSGLDYIDLRGVRTLVDLAREGRNGLVLHDPSRGLRRILDLGWGQLPELTLVGG